MRVSDRLKRVPADAYATCHEDDPHDEGRECLDTPVAVWVILVGWLDGDYYAEQHDGRREHITRKFDAGRDNGRRLSDEADDDVECRQEGAGGNASERDSMSGPGSP